MESVDIAEKLIATVGRAFYTDTTVVILDALCRESFLKHEEIAPRLKLSAKDVQKALNQLENEMLIRFEDLLMEDMRNSRCYYIDYQLFVNIVRLRVYHMQQMLKVNDSQQMQHIHFECPTCRNQLSELDVQRCVSKDNKFVCTHCCPSENIAFTESEAWFRLVEIDNRGKLVEMISLEKKMSDQLNSSELHEGIYDLLAQLKNVRLPRNKPSDNVKRGFNTSKIMDKETLKLIEETSHRYRGKARKAIGNEEQEKFSGEKDAMGRNIIMEFEDMSDGQKASMSIDKSKFRDSQGSASKSLSILEESVAKRPRIETTVDMPDFLRNSRVTGALEVLESVSLMQKQRDSAGFSNSNENYNYYGSSKAEPAKQMTVSNEKEKVQKTKDVDDDEDDINWES